MHLPGGVSVIFIVGLVVCVVGITLHLIGLATPEWSVYGTASSGLFQSCGGSGCSSRGYAGTSSDENDSIRAAAAMNVIGALFGLAAITVALIHLGIGCLNKEPTRFLSLLAGVLAIVAFVFILIGVAVWGGAVHDDKLTKPADYDLGYSFAFCVTGGIIHLIAGILFLVGNMSSVGSS